MNPLTPFVRSTAVAIAVSAFVATAAYAQLIPASSADSGRRAVIAIDQASINNNIQNATNIGNNANAYADYASHQANNAQNSANTAQNGVNNLNNTVYGSGGMKGTWATTPGVDVETNQGGVKGKTSAISSNASNPGETGALGGCLWGMGDNNLKIGSSSATVKCPSGSGWASTATWQPGQDKSPSGTGGGGGSGGGSS
ncbi:hypothetical protein [Variovorax ginsengisoli]|nr:hypothetical protein [Variovorax ginsengisoli]